MGTRSLSGVVIDGTIKASYAQYDGYPSGIGVQVLDYCWRLASLSTLDSIKERWRTIVLVNEQDEPTPEQQAALVDAGMQPQNVSTGVDWYSWLRDNQGDLQAMEDTGFITDSWKFGFDSLFCEWAWLVDLDAHTLECYVGFQKEPVAAGRFAGGAASNGYYGVKLIQTYPLDNLPEADDFVYELNQLTADVD